MKKISFKARRKLIKLSIILFFSRLKMSILNIYLKKRKIKPKINPYEDAKFDFTVSLIGFIIEIKTRNNIEKLNELYKELLESRFLFYGVDHREFKDFLRSLIIPIPDEEKDKVAKRLVEKLDEIQPNNNIFE